MNGPLEGIKVVDCSIWLQGPMTGALLADLGADVIKIEQLGQGDPFRGLTNVSLQLGERDLGFETINRNKRGIAVDLRSPEGTAVISNLVKKSDVFLHNLRPQAAERLGLSYEILSRLNSKLIYSQASGWGLQGPDSNKGAYNDYAAARTGMMYISGEPDLPKPQRTPPTMCDVAGSLCLALATVSALQAREHLGRGQMVDTSIFGATITLLRWPITFALALGIDTLQRPRSEGAPLYNFYQCSDGEWIYLVMAQYDKYWPAFCEAMGIKDMEKDPRFENTAAVLSHSAELITILDRIFATKTRAEWMQIFAERDFQFAAIQKTADLVNDPQALANDYIMEYDHPVYGWEKVIGLPYQFSETQPSIRYPCPQFGQHTEEVLLEFGYTWEDIAGLKEKQII